VTTREPVADQTATAPAGANPAAPEQETRPPRRPWTAMFRR
jgi:hypothetical protein